MPAHTTNYVDTFIVVAADTTATTGTPPPVDRPTVASLTYRMIADAPYRQTSDDVIFTVHADRAGIPQAERAAAREEYFAKGRPCLRASDLGKRWGWGVHSDGEGRVALYGMETPEYARLARGGGLDDGDPPVAVTRAMRSRR